MSAFLEVRNLKVQRQSFLVEVPSLDVGKGTIHVLKGPSGSGKSTILQAIAGFEEAEGEIRVGESVLSNLYPEERKVGFVFQQNALFPHLSLSENVAFGLKVRSVPKKERDDRSEAWLKRVGLSGMGQRKVSEISGGEAQRVQLARALICGFPVLLLDEPFSALDAVLREDLRLLVKKLVKETEVACILVSHDEQDIKSLGDSVSYLEKGKIVRSERVPSA